jgi:transposase InsO family protein
MCDVLNVSESGYYRYLKNQGKPSSDAVLSAQITEIVNEVPYNRNYGVPRMQMALEQRGKRYGTRKISRVMRIMGLIHPARRRPKGLTKVTTEIEEKENLIKQDFTASEPGKKLLTDITQVQCSDGKLYVSPILDCFDGKIAAMKIRDNMKKDLCIDTVTDLQRRQNLRGAILHSDRGSQYTSYEFRNKLLVSGITQSLSGVNHCYDNARMESFFATLKKELIYQIPTYKMKKDEVTTLIYRYVFAYYNRERVYTTNPGGLPPDVYREKFLTTKEVAA